jgi:L-alanine-DL-glutamate epimerase-like enolase superfamily enzyme
LKITSIETTPLRTGQLLVQVHTDEGITGLGECYVLSPGVVKFFIDDLLAPIVIGKDPTQTGRRWDEMFYATTRYGPMGLQTSAIGAIDLALWDIAGKAAGKPVSELLGGPARTSIPVYLSTGMGWSKAPEEMLQTVQQGYENGFRAFKIRMDWNSDRLDREPAEDMRRFSTCRDFLPDDVPLSFDANNGYSSSTAIRQGRALEAMGAAHFEEPVPQHDMPGLRDVSRALDIPISFGEQQHTRWQFRDLIELGQPDILQPDIVLAGGITESRRIYDLAETFGKQVMPHCPTAGIANAASLQLYSTFINSVRPHEYSQEFSGSPADLLAEPYVRSGSEIALPGRPGLGIELDESKLALLVLDE